MTVETPAEVYPWDAPKDDGTVQMLSVTATLTEQTGYSFNLVGPDWPYGLYVGSESGILLWFDNPAAVNRLIGELAALNAAPKGEQPSDEVPAAADASERAS